MTKTLFWKSISFPKDETIDFNNKDGLQIPSGDTSERPLTPSAGTIRYNTDINKIEYYSISGQWEELSEPLIFDSVADFRLNTKQNATAKLSGYYNPKDGGEGEFLADPSDTTSSDDGGFVIVDAIGTRWKRVNTSTFNTKQWGIFPGTVDAFAVIAMNTALLGRPVIWDAGTYNIDDRLTLGSIALNWISNGVVTLKLSRPSHYGETWIRTDGSVTLHNFIIDGDNKIAKLWDARSSGTYTHTLDFRGTTFKNGVQPSSNGISPDTGHSCGLIVRGKFSRVDIRETTFSNFDALAAEGGDRPVSRGFAIDASADNMNSPKYCIADGSTFENIICSNAPWAALNIDADGIVWRNNNPTHSFFGRGITFRNCQKRYFKSNVGLNAYLTDPIVYGVSGKPTRLGFDWQSGSGGIKGGTFFFEDASAFPTGGVLVVLPDGETLHRAVTFDNIEIICPEEIPDDGSGGSERCILGISGSGPTGMISMTNCKIHCKIPVLVYSRMNAVASSADALNLYPLRRAVVKDNYVEEITVTAFRMSRSGTGFVYGIFDVSGNVFMNSPNLSQTSVEYSDSNVTAYFRDGNGEGISPSVPTLSREGFVMQPPTDGQILANFPSNTGRASTIVRESIKAVGTVATAINPTPSGVFFGLYIVRGERTAAAGGGNRHFTDIVVYTISGAVTTLGSAVRNAPDSRTYSISGGSLMLAMGGGSYDIDVLALGVQ